eukprot:scaffold62036_cov73-Phaeocystis_antarctica.AAC.3
MRPRTTWSATSVCSGPATGERKRAAPPEGAGSRRCSSGWTGSAHRKARRRKRSTAPQPVPSAAPPDTLCSTACATVPLYPKDDTPPTSPPASLGPIANRPVGSAHAAPPRSASPTRRLSRRSCAFGAASLRASPAANTSSPAIAAAGSACPAFALTLPNASGACASSRACSSAACSEPASIGSPSAVPVPCASSRATPAAATPASASAACSSARCAVPLGAVRLALRPRRLQHRRAARLSAHVAVRAGVEGVAPPCHRRHARHREREADGRGEHEVDRREQCALALAQLHRSPRGVTRHKRRRAGGVERDARPLQSQHVRQPARRDGVAAARRGINAVARWTRLEHLGKVVRGDAEEHARRAANELGSPQPGRVERL